MQCIIYVYIYMFLCTLAITIAITRRFHCFSSTGVAAFTAYCIILHLAPLL